MVLERETGRLVVLDTVNETRMFVDEFLDILDDEFCLWDSSGQRLRFEKGFILGDDSGIVATGEDRPGLKHAIEVFLTGNEADSSVARKLEPVLRRLED